jgi:hypothetical protein
MLVMANCAPWDRGLPEGLAEWLELEGVESTDVFGFSMWKVLVVRCPNHTETLVEPVEVLLDCLICGPVGKLVVIKPEPPDVL